jgi:hypothetical protein
MLFNREFFETDLIRHCDEKRKYSHDGSVSVRLKLTNAVEMSVLVIKQVTDSYVVFEVFPLKGSLRKHTKDDRTQGAPIFDLDRIAVPYSMIAEVEITTRQIGQQKIGFQ